MIEDSKGFFINITQINFLPYTEAQDSSGAATIITTEYPIEGISKKAGFHLMKNVDLNFTEAIESGNLTSYEKQFIGNEGNTFQAVRSNFKSIFLCFIL